MPRPDRLWLVLLAGVLAVAVGGCKSQPKARLGPSEAPVYSVRDPDNVRRQVRLQDLLALAARDMQVGNLDAAERKAREALKLAPESPDALVLMAGIDERRGRTQQAGESFRRAAEQAPQRGDVLNNYGAWLCQQGRPAESLAWFDRALQAPGYATPAEAQANAGGCALDAGQLERAERDLRAALSTLPGNPVALEAMAQLSFRQGRYMEARAFAERRIAAAPATRSVLQLASQIEARLGDRAASDRYIQRIRQEFPQEAGS
ncbi:type IV pilus biogenesis/stability protein PilW [Stenotrophomonas sp. GD03819]|jgi:type IV pilus assembly protein PilF|uniref:type IV pilus biogenesis/stability protein PilW n=1 Tax=Stenotrophomonas TaxID=40323 RepID=UPI0013134C3B|nr:MULTISPECIES: type IV pilus biogenesis/stability protein PilW [Stenotrophomonas]MBH1854284.1 type IV pilus biogenesis/stability protein PilW [Stenotrophomonas maltophilia]MCI1104676.1 type IV pilus biogenesis/stability protein PilW [Stenotrophomonas maltophilia]MDC7800968.1 type IV pilus biogenesis/stability protein PilW [Stenotrophomonas geniculata]MDH1791437.1 type IV pilus biogenesis/stability protein PilW [Stenotrophomonas sp. GD03819]CAH0064218.1 Type IV pilus biogenesis/stability prot